MLFCLFPGLSLEDMKHVIPKVLFSALTRSRSVHLMIESLLWPLLTLWVIGRLLSVSPQRKRSDLYNGVSGRNYPRWLNNNPVREVVHSIPHSSELYYVGIANVMCHLLQSYFGM